MLRVHTRILLLLAVLLRSVQSLNSATQAHNPQHYWPHAASHATAATKEGTGLVSRIADGMKEASSKISAFAKDVADHARAATHETVDNVHNAICDRFQGFVDSIKKAVFGKGTPVEKKEPKDAKGTSVEEKTPKHDAKEATSDGTVGSPSDSKVDAKESTINASLGSSTVDTKVKVDAKEITALGKPENSKDPEVATEKATPRELMFACMGLEEASKEKDVEVDYKPFNVCSQSIRTAVSVQETGEDVQPEDEDLESCCVKLYEAEDDELLLKDKATGERADDLARRPTSATISKYIGRRDAAHLREAVKGAKANLAGARFKHLKACRGRGAVEVDFSTLREKSMAVKGRGGLRSQCRILMQTYVESYFGDAGDAMVRKVTKIVADAVDKIESYGPRLDVEETVKEERVANLVILVAKSKLDCSKSEEDIPVTEPYKQAVENARRSGCSEIEENVKKMFKKELEYTKNPRPLSLGQMKQMYELMDAADKEKTKSCAAVPERAPVAKETSASQDTIWRRPFALNDTDTAGIKEYEKFRDFKNPPMVGNFKLPGSDAFDETCQNIECKDKPNCCETREYTLMRVGPSTQGNCYEYTTAQVLLYYTLSDSHSVNVWDPVFTSKFRLDPFDCEFCIVEEQEKTDLVQFVAKVPFKWQVRACTQDELDKSTARENDSKKAKEFDEKERDLYKKTTLLACQVKAE